MAQQQQDSMFGDDINSTPIAKLQQMPAMTTKAEMGPVEPPVYNPTVELQQQQKHVRFADDDDYEDDYIRDKSKKKKDRRHRKHRHKSRDLYPMAAQYYPQYPVAAPVPPPVAEAAVPKKTKVLELLHTYGHRAVVFALFVGVLWYYRKLASFPYVGSNGYVTTVGTLGIALAASGIYGVIESLLDN
jgi:hypothetical protein